MRRSVRSDPVPSFQCLPFSSSFSGIVPDVHTLFVPEATFSSSSISINFFSSPLSNLNRQPDQKTFRSEFLIQYLTVNITPNYWINCFVSLTHSPGKWSGSLFTEKPATLRPLLSHTLTALPQSRPSVRRRRETPPDRPRGCRRARASDADVAVARVFRETFPSPRRTAEHARTRRPEKRPTASALARSLSLSQLTRHVGEEDRVGKRRRVRRKDRIGRRRRLRAQDKPTRRQKKENLKVN